jgi:hypothetical protein
MTKKIIFATLAVFVTWAILDFLIHRMMLGSTYQAIALFRPVEEVKMVLMYLVTLLAALVFVTIYARLVSPKNVARGMGFGLLFGVGTGISMGYGIYSIQLIPSYMALTWFLGTAIEATVAGLITGLIVTEEDEDEKPAE